MFNLFKRENKSEEYNFPTDVLEQIKIDFEENADQAQNTILTTIAEHPFLKVKRTIRCVIHLANGSLTELEKSLNIATEDPRDVMFLAEYINRDKENPDRIRDFNKPFGKERIA